MKKLIVFTLIIAYTSPVQSKNLSAFFSYCSFDVPGKTPYVEMYLNVIGTTVNFVPSEKNTLAGQIDVQWIIKSGDKIVHADKYTLLSPNINESDNLVPDFIDQQRINLETGTYDIELKIRDKNTTTKETTLKQKINVSFPTDTISISDIEFIESYSKSISIGKFTKSGYDVLPFVNAFYPKEITSLKFYAEIYRSKLHVVGDYLARYYISNNETHQQIENYIVSMKQSAKDINVLIGNFSIVDLPSGNYNLNIEVRNNRNELIAFNSAFFQRSNERNKPLVSADISAIDVTNTFISQVINRDTLAEYIASLYPISTQAEVEFADNQILARDVHSMKQFFYYFWTKRNPDDPEKAWNDYKEEVRKVNNSYSTRLKKGYDTERGRVYLQYGPPNIVSKNYYEPGAAPYEIWQFYKLKNQSNRKFIFYAPDLSTNEFRLLHSDAVGEIQDPDWEKNLQISSKGTDPYGSHINEYYSNPH